MESVEESVVSFIVHVIIVLVIHNTYIYIYPVYTILKLTQAHSQSCIGYLTQDVYTNRIDNFYIFAMITPQNIIRALS